MSINCLIFAKFGTIIRTKFELDISNDELSGNGHVANYDYGHLVLSMYANS